MQSNQTSLSWSQLLSAEKKKPYFLALKDFLNKQYKLNKTIYPAKKDIFTAIKLCSYVDTKVVIMGQDPYHGPNQAHGLSFSVPHNIAPPPSLCNIFKELNTDLNIPIPHHGCLQGWATQGVLLLNSSLTVEAHKPQSHAQIGWNLFTDAILEHLNKHPKPVVFMLWGNFAQKKSHLIDKNYHCVLLAPHPSPLSAYRGFLGCCHFSQANNFLIRHGRTAINWQLE